MSRLMRACRALLGARGGLARRAFTEGASDTAERISELLHKDKVVVFMKGIPTQPLCGFSNAVVQILRMHGVENYTTYNVLEDESLREDVHEPAGQAWSSTESDLDRNVGSGDNSPTLHERCRGMRRDTRLNVYPRDGFCDATPCLQRTNHSVYHRFWNPTQAGQLQGIKEFSNWPTIPQVFFNGEFVGGCDILLQMHQNGDLVEELQKVGIMSALQFDETKN